MVETMVSLTILVAVVVFWGSNELFMQRHEQEKVLEIEKMRNVYTKRQQHLFTVKVHA